MILMDRKPFEYTMEQLRQEAQDWYPLWKELQAYIAPERGFFQGQQPNKSKGIDYKILLDSTPTRDLRIFASGMMGLCTSPSRPWFKIGLPDRELMEFHPVKIWLNDVQQILMDIYSRSNIYNTFYTLYEELGAFCTAAAYIGEDYNDVVRGRAFTIGQYYLGTGPDGRVNTFARDYWMTVYQLVKEFGYDNVSVAVKNAYDNNKLFQWFQVCHLIVPNEWRIPGKLDNRNKEYLSVQWEAGAPADTFLRISGYDEFPIIAPRTDVLDLDAYGRNGPGRLALGDSKTLQILAKDELISLDKLNNPPMQKPEDVGVVDLTPGGVTTNNSTGQKVEPLFQVNPPLQATKVTKDDYRKGIDACFFTDLFLMASYLDKSGVTATEILEKHAEKIIQLGPFIERLETEMFDPAIERTFAIAYRKGLIPTPPEELQGMPLNIEYISTMAQAQKMVQTTAIKETIAFAGQLAAAKPEVLDNVDFDETLEQFADMNGVSPGILRGSDEVAQIRKERIKAQQQQAAMQAAMAMAEGAKTLSETDTGSNNALTALLGMPGGGL